MIDQSPVKFSPTVRKLLLDAADYVDHIEKSEAETRRLTALLFSQWCDWADATVHNMNIMRQQADHIAELEAEVERVRDYANRMDVLSEHRLSKCTELDAEVAERDTLLANIWLYVNWRYLTKQMTTNQKELWADAVDYCGIPGTKADRWWRNE